jgi:hypothetical protein
MVRVGEAGEDQPGTTREAVTTSVDPASSKSVHDIPTATNGHGETTLEPLDRDWLLDLQVLGRSPKTIDWYRKHVQGYFPEGSVRTLDQLTAAELKGYLAAVQARGLAENTVHRVPDDQGVDEYQGGSLRAAPRGPQPFRVRTSPCDLLTYPVVVGQGARLFRDSGPESAFELVTSRATSWGIIIHTYRPLATCP